ncbi:uncharacterized protein LOC106028573 [Cavia porcellus]|uniref:uncharacterized protein LOC106028573 n=1 Tax=Cavia porcellus TaxID=10141 RepID=UPI002FE2ED0F
MLGGPAGLPCAACRPLGVTPGAGKPRAGRAGPAGEEEGTWRGYLGSGAGERSPLSRRCSAVDASRPWLPHAARCATRPPPRGVRARPPLLGHTAARAGPAASSSRAAPRRGTSRARRPALLAHSRALGDRRNKRRIRRASQKKRTSTNAGSATRAAPLPQRRRRPGPCCCCQLVEKTLSMRARRPHPGNFRVWPTPPPPLAALLSPGCPRLPPQETGGWLCAGARAETLVDALRGSSARA